jgi:hypothetical protein
VSPSGTQPVGFGLRRVLLSLFLVFLTGGGIVLAWPRLAQALDGAAEAARETDARLLCVAAVLFAAGPASCGLLWQRAIARAGGRLSPAQACARYGMGSLVNSFAPCHLGDVVRAALLVRALPRGTPRGIARCLGLVQAARVTALAAFALASWLPPQLAPLPALGAIGMALACRKRGIVVLAFLAPATKVAAVTVTLYALGMSKPLGAALAVVPALELAGLLPLTPANLGAASAAISVVLHARGFPLAEAVSASIVLHGVETAAGILFGAGSAVFLLMSGDPTRASADSLPRRKRVGFGALPAARAASSAP